VPPSRSCARSETPRASSSAKPCVTSMRVRPAACSEVERTTAVFHTAPRRHDPEPRLSRGPGLPERWPGRGCRQSPQCH
jgi:hypothetical protein